MKIFNTAFVLILLSFFSIFLNSCTTENYTDGDQLISNHIDKSLRNGEYSELMIEFEERLARDESFINFTRSYFKSKILISEIEIKKIIETDYEVEMVNDSINIETVAVQSSLADLTLFYHYNQDFDLLSDEEKEIVANNVLMKAYDNVNRTLAINPNATFTESSLESAIVDFQNDFDNLVSILPPTVTNPNTGDIIASTDGLTWEEVGGCAIAGLGSFIGSHWKVVKGIYGLLTGGPVTYTLVLAAVGVVCPQIKAASAIASFAACIIKEYIW